MERMTFCTDRSKIAYHDYLQEMRQLYGPDFTVDDPDVWARVQAGGQTSRVFGIGSSDINYVVTGTPTSSYAIGPSFADYRQSQEKVQNLEKLIEIERQTRDAMIQEERQAREESQRRMEESQRRMQEEFQKQFEQFTRNWRPPSN